MRIRPEPTKALTAGQECELTRQALARNPASSVLRLRLAKLLNQLDAFDEAVAVLTDGHSDALGFEALRALAWAYLALSTEHHDRLAYETSRRALAAAASDTQRSFALADQAKALVRLGKADAACDLLRSALQLEPHNKEAFRRLVFQLSERGEPAAVVAMTDHLASQGVGHARLFAARARAFAQLGQFDRARETVNLDEFLYHRPISPPAGWNDLDHFNAALASELLAHPGMRYGRYGTASEKTWRIDAPAVGAAPAVRALLALIAETAERHSATLRGHPWIDARPDNATLRSWCVITGGDGFEHWHVHRSGWMTGGYYAQVPASVERGEDDRGCLALGLPPGLIGEDAAGRFGQTRIRPKAGSLTLFPSHAYHRTFPHGGDGDRICIAFDIGAEAAFD